MLLNPCISDIIPLGGNGMPKLKDLTNKIFGRLTVLKRINLHLKRPQWIALCECGKETICSSGDLNTGDKKSCGCFRQERLRQDLTNIKFGKLLCLEIAPKRGKSSSQFWRCKCECGKETTVSAQHLKNKEVTSCGCLTVTPEIAQDYKDLFLANVEKTDGCWNWKGRINNGYGIFFAGKFIKAHRFSFILHNNKTISKKNIICHHCDNPKCVNPAHIYSGTHKTNAEDKQRRGRCRKPKSLNVR